MAEFAPRHSGEGLDRVFRDLTYQTGGHPCRESSVQRGRGRGVMIIGAAAMAARIDDDRFYGVDILESPLAEYIYFAADALNRYETTVKLVMDIQTSCCHHFSR